MHLLHAFTPDGTPLGTLSAEAWTREPKDEKTQAKRGSSEKRVQIARKPFEEKETYRWLQTAEHCEDIKQHCQQTQLVMLADRECDITEVIDYCTTQQNFDWVIRSDIDRVLNKARKQDPSIKVRDQLASTKPLYSHQLSIRSREQWGSQSLKQRPGKADRDAMDDRATVQSAQECGARLSHVASSTSIVFYLRWRCIHHRVAQLLCVPSQSYSRRRAL